MTDISQLPLESVIEIDGVVRRTLDTLQVETVQDLANLDLSKAATLRGVGERKLDVLEQLIAKARLHLKLAAPEPKSLRSQVAIEQATKPLLFVPKFLSRSFDALKIFTVGNLLDMGAEQLSGQPGWGHKKLEVLQALQRLYVQITKAVTTADRGTKVADLVERVLIPSEAVAATSVLEFISNSTNSFGLNGATLSDLEQLRRLIGSVDVFRQSEIHEGGYHFRDAQLSALEWRDVPLQLNKRCTDFLDTFHIETLGQIDSIVSTGLVADSGSCDLVAVEGLDNFGGGSFQTLKKEIARLAKLGLLEYRRGIVPSLEELPDSEMSWREVPLRVPARVESFLDSFRLDTLKDVHRLSVRGQVFCDIKETWILATDQKNFTERSLNDLRKQLFELADLGLEKYRFGESAEPKTVTELAHLIEKWLSPRHFEVLRRRCNGETLDETSHHMDVTRERTRQMESKAFGELTWLQKLARAILEPTMTTLNDRMVLSLLEFLSIAAAEDIWQIQLCCKIAEREFHLMEVGVSRFSKRQLESLAILLRDAAATGHFQQTGTSILVFDLLACVPESDKWFIPEWKALFDAGVTEIPISILPQLVGYEWLQTCVRTQLVDAGVNGLDFLEIDTCGTVSNAADLSHILREDAHLLTNGRFRRPGKVYQRGDEIVAIVRNASSPITSQQIIDACSENWSQPQAVRFLTECYETVQAGRGLYVHIEKLSLCIADVQKIAAWGAELLAGEKTQVEGSLMLELFHQTNIGIQLDNEYQLVSIVAKHPDVRRVSANLQLAHKSTFDDSELFLAATDPDLASQWHPHRNGSTTPDQIRPTSAKLHWWQCKEGHEFQVSPVYRTTKFRPCPLCEGKWTIGKLRHFVKSLRDHLDAFTPAELYVIFQQSGLWKTDGKSKSFVKALATGRFPRKELDKFVEGEESLVDDFLNDDEFQLDQHSATEERDSISASVDETTIEEDQQSSSLAPLPEVRTQRALTALNSIVFASTDGEAADFLIASAKAKIWTHAYRDESSAVQEAKSFTGSVYSEQVKTEFLREYEDAKSLAIPTGYAFTIDGTLCEPNLMQRHVTCQVRDKLRYGNWSGTGAGKTLSAILATRVCGAELTVVCCPNAVVGEDSDGWATEIVRVFPDSEVVTKTLKPQWKPVGTGHRYLVLNYEQLQQPNSEALLKRLVDNHRIDFIVIDEVHYAKQRYAEEMSQRKRLLQSLVSTAGQFNPNLRVLGLSATPVINNLQEGRSLVEMITGVEHDDLQVKPTVANCMRLHQKLATMGTRWRPQYEAALKVELIDVDCTSFLPAIRALGKNHSPLDLEKILTRARLPSIIGQLSRRKPTLIYTHYVDAIDRLLYDAITGAGFRVGFCTGGMKDGLKPFKAGNLDVLIGSSSIGTGVDGLQHCCDQLIINVLPWTNAEYEQLIGRIWRQGQTASKVSVIIPVTFAEINGHRWSYCDSKLNRIRYKKSIADAAVDGAVPEGNLRSPVEAQRDIMQWLERLESGLETTISRRTIVVPLSDDESSSRKRLARYGDFSNLNNRWNQTRSDALHKRLAENPEEWEQYHTYYRAARAQWPVVPVDEMIAWCRKRQGYVIGDFGCGEALIAKAVGERHEVISIDHIGIDSTVIECDMAQTAIESESLDVAMFCLSLMGSNFTDYVREAYRCLKIDGHFHIWEATSRFHDIDQFCRRLETLGFRTFDPVPKGQFTHIEAQKTDRWPALDFDLEF